MWPHMSWVEASGRWAVWPFFNFRKCPFTVLTHAPQKVCARRRQNCNVYHRSEVSKPLSECVCWFSKLAWCHNPDSSWETLFWMQWSTNSCSENASARVQRLPGGSTPRSQHQAKCLEREEASGTARWRCCTSLDSLFVPNGGCECERCRGNEWWSDKLPKWGK